MHRRKFLQYGLASSAAFTMAGLTTLVPRGVLAANISLQLNANATYRTMGDGNSLYTWEFLSSNAGPGTLGSGLVVTEGDTITITLQNNLDRSINLEIPGVMENTPSVSPGSARSYTFTAPAAGTYFYHENNTGGVGKAMGLAGPLIVMPAVGENKLTGSGPSFDRQFTLVYQDYDDQLNAAIQQGGNYNMDNYDPNYFVVNGLAYPETSGDSETAISMQLGEDVAVRFVNAGHVHYPMHFHGYHVNVIHRNRIVEQNIVEKDTVNVGTNECVDVILPVEQTGLYPLHTHFVPGVTANGTYPNGGLIVMSAA